MAGRGARGPDPSHGGTPHRTGQKRVGVPLLGDRGLDALTDVASGDVRFRPSAGPTPAVSKTAGYDPQPTWALPLGAEHWSLTMLREKLVKIGAKVVRHGRYVTFQLADVAVSRDLFRKILSLIDDLRPRPSPA